MATGCPEAVPVGGRRLDMGFLVRCRGLLPQPRVSVMRSGISIFFQYDTAPNPGAGLWVASPAFAPTGNAFRAGPLGATCH